MEPWEQEWTDYYRILRLHPDAEPEIVRCTYLRLAQLFHPDKDPSPGADIRFSQINEAFETLRDPDRRALYHRAYTGRSTGYGWANQHKAPVSQPDDRRQELFRQAELRRAEFRKQRESELRHSLEIQTTDPGPVLFVLGVLISVAAAILVTLSDIPEFLFVVPSLCRSARSGLGTGKKFARCTPRTSQCKAERKPCLVAAAMTSRPIARSAPK
jgi:hypothetical protein